MLGSVGITHHRRYQLSFIHRSGSSKIRRDILKQASETADQAIEDNATDLLTKIIRSARLSTGARREFHSELAKTLIPNFSDLREVGSRWASEQSTNWPDILHNLQINGYTIRDQFLSLSADIEMINAVNLVPVLEVVAADGSVISGGSGLKREAALSSALAEAVERLVAQTVRPENSFIASADQLRRNGFYVPYFEVGPRDAYSEGTIIDWIAANTLTGKPAAMPAELAYYDPNFLPTSGIRAFALHHTMGLAAGSTLEEAIWSGLTECLERDAYWIVMRCLLKCPTLDNKILGSEYTELLNSISVAGLRVVLKDISLDWPLKIVHAIILDESDRLPAFAHGVGSHTTTKQAAAKALLECLQMRGGLTRLSTLFEYEILLPTVGGKEANIAWSDPASALLFQHLVEEADEISTSFDNTPHQQNIEGVIAHLQKKQKPVVWVDLQNDEPLCVVRVHVPGCVRPDHTADYVPQRLRHWLDKEGIRSPYYIPMLT